MKREVRLCVAAGAALLFTAAGRADARPFFQKKPALPEPTARALPVKRAEALDDSLRLSPAPDLALDNAALRKADALSTFIEGARLEESGELVAALAAYQKVLTVDPGEIDLASRVASLLTRQEDFPRAVDVLKDAIKANPKEVAPYLQLAFIYAKHLQKPDQAIKFANQAIALDPEDLDAYQRIYEIELGANDSKKALATLDRAAKIDSKNPNFWTRLGKLYATILFVPEVTPTPEDLRRVSAFFKRAAENSGDDAAATKDAADFYAASQQLQEAIPLYLKVLELEPDDLNVREKLATSFAITNQRGKAIEMLQEIIKQTPEKYQSYDLLAQLLDEDGRVQQRAKQFEAAKTTFAKAAANYEQSLLINPTRGGTTLRLAELLIGPLRESARAETILTEARARFPRAPEFTYYLGLAQREAKHAQQAVITFEEALQEAEETSSTMLNARFYFDYAAAAEAAGLYDKAADLCRRSIALDPATAAEAYNFLGYMWAERNTHLDEADEMIKRALELDPNNGAYLDSLGWLHFRKGKFDEALANLTRAAQILNREDPVVFEHLGDTYAKLNRVPQALEYWQKAIALDPENKALAAKIEGTKTKMSKGEAVKGSPLQ